MAVWETLNKGQTLPKINHGTCYGGTFGLTDVVSVNLYWMVDPSPEDSAFMGVRSHYPEDLVQKHIALVRKAGFVFKDEIVNEIPDYTNNKRAYKFSLCVGENSPLMTRFCMNVLRWINGPDGCLDAFRNICESGEIDLDDPLAVFNAHAVASLTNRHNDSHNIGVPGTGYLKPLTKEQYNYILTQSTALDYMYGQFQMAGMNPDPTVTCYLARTAYPWLKEPGAWKRYMAELQAAINKDLAARTESISELSQALGLIKA